MVFLKRITPLDSSVLVDSAQKYFSIRASSDKGCMAYGDTVYAPYIPTGSIKDLEQRIFVSPQPTSGVLMVRLSGSTKVNSFLLYDIRGVLVQCGEIRDMGKQGYMLSMNHLTDGVYLLEAQYGRGLSARKKVVLTR